nr:hypothetical protein [Tanacetum cinerariifolium]
MILDRSVPAARTRSVPAARTRSVPAARTRSVPAAQTRLVHAARTRSVPSARTRSVPAARTRSERILFKRMKSRVSIRERNDLETDLNRMTDLGGRINLRRTIVIGFSAQSNSSSNTIALDSPHLLVLNTGASQSRQHVDTSLIHIESRKSPTAELFDVDSERISIHHCEYLKSITLNVLATITGIMRRTYLIQNDVMRKAAKTMLIFSCAPLFLWAEAIATACFTQNCSIIHHRFNKTPYELINGKKPDISFLHVFDALCYPKNDHEDIRKLGAKGDIGFFIGYSTDSCAYRVYNQRTKKIMETMNVSFDELSAMAFEQRSLKPGLHSMTSGHISSGLDLTYAPSTITTQQPSEGIIPKLRFDFPYSASLGHDPGRMSLLQKKFKEYLFTYCIENGIFQDFQNTSKPSNDNTNVADALQELFVVKQDPGKNSSQSPPHINHHGCYGCGDSLEDIFCHQCTCESCGKDGNSFTYDAKSNLVDDSPNVFNPPPQPLTYSYGFCGNDAYYGHDCPLQVSFTLYINTPSWDRPTICYNNDDDEDYTIVITPILLTKEPDNSLSMGDEHLDTIMKMKSDELIKSSVENLVLIPSESEDIPDYMCDVPFHDNSSPLDISKDQFEDFFDSNDDYTSIDDDSFSIDDIEYVEASPPDSELISSEVMEIVIPKVGGIEKDILLTIKDDILHEKLLNINLLIANIEALKDNPTPYSDFVTKSSSSSLNFFLEETNTFDNSLPKSETFCFDLEENISGNTTTRSDISLLNYEAFYNDHVKEISNGSTTTHFDFSLYDLFIFDLSINPFPHANRSDFYEFSDELAHLISPPEYDCFSFKNEPNLGDFTMDVVEDIFPTREPRIHVHNVLPTHPTLQLNLDFILSSESFFTYVVWIFLPFLSYSVAPQYLLSFRNEDTIFDPGISNYHISSFMPDVSHRSETFIKLNVYPKHLNESLMEILFSTCSPMDQ